MSCLALNQPDHFEKLMTGVENVHFLKAAETADVVLFYADRATLDAEYKTALSIVAESRMLWVSWPKKTSELFRDLTEDGLREVLSPTGWVDVKVCAVDQDWSGLMFLRRKT